MMAAAALLVIWPTAVTATDPVTLLARVLGCAVLGLFAWRAMTSGGAVAAANRPRVS